MKTFYCVFMENTFIKTFSTLCEADICAMGLKMWLIEHNLDTDIVKIKEEVMS